MLYVSLSYRLQASTGKLPATADAAAAAIQIYRPRDVDPFA